MENQLQFFEVYRRKRGGQHGPRRPGAGRPAVSMIGRKFGLWAVIARGKNIGVHAGFICRCYGCGKKHLVVGTELRLGRSLSCWPCSQRRRYGGKNVLDNAQE